MSMMRMKAAKRLRNFAERLQPTMTTIEFDTLAEFIEVGFCRNITDACPGIEADFVESNWAQLKELIWNVDEGIDIVFMDDITITKIKEIILVVIQRITYAVENDDIARIADVIQHSYYGINSEKRSRSEQSESNKKHFQNISGALRKR